MTCKRVLFWGVLLAVLTPPALGAQAEPDCAAWNTSEYFETATPEDVTACLAAGANVSARGTGQRTPLHQAALYNQNPAGIVTLIVLGRKGPHWIPFQAAALALSHTLNASFRNRLNVSLLHK